MMVTLIFVIPPKDAVFLFLCYFGRGEKPRSFFLALIITVVLITWIQVNNWEFCLFLNIYSIHKLRIWTDNLKQTPFVVVTHKAFNLTGLTQRYLLLVDQHQLRDSVQ